MQVSLGLLGVIIEVTFQSEAAFNLEETTEKFTLDACLLDLHQIAESAEHVKLWVEPYSNFCAVYKFNRTEKDVKMSDQVWKIGVKVRNTKRRREREDGVREGGGEI